MNVLSLFDGMSCGQIALNKLGFKVDNYFASEIDKHAIKVTQDNYPNTVQIGDVRNVKASDLPKIDLLLAGSPCQGFSFAGKQLAFDDPRSKLFFEFVRIWKEVQSINPNAKFLLENVRMKREHELVISKYMGVEPIQINSALVSAQNRVRLYWTNIANEPYGLFDDMRCTIPQPKDRGINWGKIREHNVSDNFYYSEKALNWIKRHELRKNKKLTVWGENDKCQMIEACHFKKYSSQRFFGIRDVRGLRYITPIECERAQTVPDGYTSSVSDTQRYRMLGNGWTIDVITHILSYYA